MKNKFERACAGSAMYAKVIHVLERLPVFVAVLGVIRDVRARHGGDRTIESFYLPISLRMIRRRDGVRDV